MLHKMSQNYFSGIANGHHSVQYGVQVFNAEPFKQVIPITYISHHLDLEPVGITTHYSTAFHRVAPPVCPLIMDYLGHIFDDNIFWQQALCISDAQLFLYR